MTEHAADHSTNCPDDHRLVELALGAATGRERADVLAHLLQCRACRERVEDLVELAEQLLLAAPEAEPPVGFESAVLDRIASESAGATADGRSVALRRRRARLITRVAVGAVAAIALLAAGFVLDRFVGDDTTSLAEAPMITPTGIEVGGAWLGQGDPSWILVSVPGWQIWETSPDNPLEYRLELGFDDGSTTEVGPITFDADGGAWATTSALDVDRIRTLAVIDHTGQIWCSAEF